MISLRKAQPDPSRCITLRHAGSGAEKVVEYVGMMGRPLRAQIFWPGGADYYLVAPLSGRLCGDGKKNALSRRQWQVIEADRRFLSQEWRLARARAEMPV